MPLTRVLEPEVMDAEKDAAEYEEIDNSGVNAGFVECLSEDLGFKGGSLVDLGTGPGDIPVEIARRIPGARITGVEKSAQMLRRAYRKVARSGQGERIRLVDADAKATGLPDGSFDFVVSNSVVHHIPDPRQVFREIARLVKPEGGFFIQDLRRPDTDAEVDALVERHAAADTSYQRALLRNSLRAALRPEEVEAHAKAAGLTGFTLSLPSDRHWRLSRPVRPSGVTVVRRDQIPALTEVASGGAARALGLHRDFRRHPVLKRFLPENARVSISWVRLAAGEELAVHAHPTTSVIAVASGRGRCLGDWEGDFSDGDVIVVPPQGRHGFRGAPPDGYWALSLQFEGEGLYENADAPRVDFGAGTASGLRGLLQLNQTLLERHLANPIFAFIGSGRVEDKKKRVRLLDAIQVWSDFYQLMVRLRSCFGSRSKFGAVAESHLAEEFQHNLRLAEERGPRAATLWDPTLEAGSSWFVWKMFALDEAERAALVHLVLEGGSMAFHARAHAALSRYEETRHFRVHDAADAGHLEIGVQVLEGLPDLKYQELGRVIKEGWDMLDLICARMAALAEAA